ncbi:MAG: hypothetical protein GC190_20425 [Alphaproteobacteria bacterium]|nr:hypothetical protein [Alphaproteobacteria bacterium]
MNRRQWDVLTFWKINAIKIAIVLERRGFVTRADFKHIGIDPRRWITDWLKVSPNNTGFVANEHMPNFKAQHPRNYDQIAADWDKWKPAAPLFQGALAV